MDTTNGCHLTRTSSLFCPDWARLPSPTSPSLYPKALESLISEVGKFICLNLGVKTFNQPGYARVCMDVDLMASLQQMLLVSDGDEIIYQSIASERLPHFCTHCTMLSYIFHTCHQKTNCYHWRLHLPYSHP